MIIKKLRLSPPKQVAYIGQLPPLGCSVYLAFVDTYSLSITSKVLCCSFTTVEQNTELVTLHCGKYSEVYKQPGCFFLNPCGVEKIVVSKAKISIDLRNTKVRLCCLRSQISGDRSKWQPLDRFRVILIFYHVTKP
jgi:hypothetical protein